MCVAQSSMQLSCQYVTSTHCKGGRLYAPSYKSIHTMTSDTFRVSHAASTTQATATEQGTVDRVIAKVGQEVQSLEAEMLKTLSEQTTAEKSTSKTAADITALRHRCHGEELNIAEAQNELAKLQVGGVIQWQHRCSPTKWIKHVCTVPSARYIGGRAGSGMT